MKNYDEIAEKVLKRRDEIFKKKAETKRRIVRIASPVAALCLAIVIGIGASQTVFLQDEPKTLEDALYPGIPDYVEVDGDKRADEGGKGNVTEPTIWNEIYSEDGDAPESMRQDGAYTGETVGNMLIEVTTSLDSMRLTDPISTMESDSEPADSMIAIQLPTNDGSNISYICKDYFRVNRITGKATAAMKFYDPELYYEESMTSDEMEDYIGIDIKAIENNLPKDMKYASCDYRMIYSNDGALEYDIAHFTFESDDGGRVIIHASKIMPPYDCIYMLDEEVSSRIDIDGGSIYVIAGGMGYDEATGLYDLFFADFEYGGVYFRLEFENIYREKIIASVFKMIIG